MQNLSLTNACTTTNMRHTSSQVHLSFITAHPLTSLTQPWNHLTHPDTTQTHPENIPATSFSLLYNWQHIVTYNTVIFYCCLYIINQFHCQWVVICIFLLITEITHVQLQYSHHHVYHNSSTECSKIISLLIWNCSRKI